MPSNAQQTITLPMMPKHRTPARANPGAQQPAVTEAMRDRQARGRDAEVESEEEPEMSDRESFRALEQRRIAAQILSDSEMLLMHSISRKESIPATRLHFTRILCGYDEEPHQKLRSR